MDLNGTGKTWDTQRISETPFFLQAEKWIRRLITMGSRHFVMSPLFFPGRKLTIYGNNVLSCHSWNEHLGLGFWTGWERQKKDDIDVHSDRTRTENWNNQKTQIPSGKRLHIWNITIFYGKINCKWQFFSIVMLVYQRVLPRIFSPSFQRRQRLLFTQFMWWVGKKMVGLSGHSDPSIGSSFSLFKIITLGLYNATFTEVHFLWFFVG